MYEENIKKALLYTAEEEAAGTVKGERRRETGPRGDAVSDGVTIRARAWPDVSKRRRSSRPRNRLVCGRDSYGCEVGTSDVVVVYWWSTQRIQVPKPSFNNHQQSSAIISLPNIFCHMDTNLGNAIFSNNHPKEGEGVIKCHVKSNLFTNKFILKFCAISIVSAGEYGVRF